ncbi:MAG: hypothetical protein ABIL09_21270 [Gemmatimonadota bacterium]
MKTCLVVVALSLSPHLAWGWWGDGHAIVTRAAAAALPPEAPAFLREGGERAAHCSYDPDLIKSRAVPHLEEAEQPEHFIDLELLQGAPRPDGRYAFLALCARMNLPPARVGLLPYAVVEWSERLTMALAEHRRWPGDEAIQTKALVYAGILSHYAADLCQPLHTTVDYDGRVDGGGRSPHSGVHEKMDALIERRGFTPEDLALGATVEVLPDLVAAAAATLAASHALVDRVYALEGRLNDTDDGEVADFARERGRAAAAFTASLYLTAWQQSADVKLPGWLKR